MLKIALLMKQRGLSKRKLGALTDIHPVEIGRIVSGRIKPYEKWIKKLERYFKMNEAELFEEIDENKYLEG